MILISGSILLMAAIAVAVIVVALVLVFLAIFGSKRGRSERPSGGAR